MLVTKAVRRWTDLRQCRRRPSTSRPPWQAEMRQAGPRPKFARAVLHPINTCMPARRSHFKHRHRHTDTQTRRHTDTQTQRRTETETDTHRQRRTDGRTDGRAGGWAGGRSVGRTDGRSVGRTDGRSVGQPATRVRTSAHKHTEQPWIGDLWRGSELCRPWPNSGAFHCGVSALLFPCVLTWGLPED